MKRFSRFIVNHKKFILVIYAVLVAMSVAGMKFVSIEYDLSSYLPKSMNSILGRDLLKDEFNINGTAKLLIKSSDLMAVKNIKDEIKRISGVKNVISLDDVEDITKPESFFDKSLTKLFRVSDYNLLQIEFSEGNDTVSTDNAMEKIDSLVTDEHYIGGPAAVSKDMKDTVDREIILYSLAAFAIILAILFLSTQSYLEPILFFIVLGAAIILNMGTNFIFGRISSNTYSVANILQLAVSMDYSIFLLHRFHEELQTRDSKAAMREAIEKTFSSISASAFTTICGFLALLAMRYGMGKDMGLVLAKGVTLSLISVITLLPVIALITETRFSQYKHRVILPSFDKSAKHLIKIRYASVIIGIIIMAPVFLGQSKLNYYYSTEKTLSKSSKAIIANNKINEIFGGNNQLILIVPKSNRAQIDSLTVNLKKIENVASVDGLYTAIDPVIPEFLLPKSVVERYSSDKYTYLVLELLSAFEGDMTKTAVNSIRSTAKQYNKEYYLTGEAAVYLDLKDVTSNDFTRVNIISTILIALIILITFRSLLIPLILVVVIQLGIWINLSIPYFQGVELNFISFIIIGAIQLGATVDYAILLTSRYKENLEFLTPVDAITQAIRDTGRSVLTSALILMAGTLSVSFITSIRSASELTMLIGRGALISLILVYTLLPALLLIFGRAIKHTTLNWPELKKKQG